MADTQLQIARANTKAQRKASRDNGKLLLEIAALARPTHAAQATAVSASNGSTSARRDAMLILADMEKCAEKMAAQLLSEPMRDLYAKQYARLQQELEQAHAM